MSIERHWELLRVSTQERTEEMSVPVRLVLCTALLTLLALPAVSTATIADDHDHYRVDRDGDRGDHDRYRVAPDEDRGGRGHYSGAPGPIAGAGLPILALGYGAYWLIRRSRRKPN
jgi:hypothetical protein